VADDDGDEGCLNHRLLSDADLLACWLSSVLIDWQMDARTGKRNEDYGWSMAVPFIDRFVVGWLIGLRSY